MREQFPPRLRSVEDVANRLIADRNAPRLDQDGFKHRQVSPRAIHAFCALM
jgi:hypothetical protein